MKKLLFLVLIFLACASNSMNYKSYKIEVVTSPVSDSSELSYATATVYDSSGCSVYSVCKVIDDWSIMDRRENIQELFSSAINWIDNN